MKSSRIPGFYKMPIEERIKIVKEFAGLSDEEAEMLLSFNALPKDIADVMIENVVSCMQLPLGIATNFIINGKEILVPMAIEETSVVAAASNAAKMARPDGFKAKATEPIMIGQIQILNPSKDAKEKIMENKEDILSLANAQDKILVDLGGGAKDLEARWLSNDMMVVHLLVDVRDAMGANAVNTMAEAVAPLLEKITGGKALLRIISNLAIYRLAEAEVIYKKDAIGGEEVVDKVVKAYEFASLDIFRAATHNKGIMNGIDAVAIATGNDWRAIEAGAHAYAAMNGYKPLTTWKKNDDGDLYGKIKLPLAVGIIGGATKVHPMAKICLKILGVKTAKELAEIMAAVGLAQNFAALRALATKGIQAGHMKLHAQNIAVMAGAKGEEIDVVAKKMIELGKIRMDVAQEILKEIRKK
ncbi:MAG TPA: hydroxymethylglutaryl-CoA reductase, degradative [Thermoplasmatales archaeon]|nr:hydroxymethylglutaryl-CoA reductase, degradative [Thermoplasmatales archaeon]